MHASGKSKVGSVLTIAVIGPAGDRRVIGHRLDSGRWHRNELIHRLRDWFERTRLEFNTAAHNRRFPITRS
jgi:hypothetical protein